MSIVISNRKVRYFTLFFQLSINNDYIDYLAINRMLLLIINEYYQLLMTHGLSETIFKIMLATLSNLFHFIELF